ncbi:MAG TPA: hypothetical protein VHE99_02840 [Gammaproteobacteria bacterium]|nr:hypothetical protein [Gammaproteobacteria bacterium]HVY53304.1 hypothetical protein [Gammaproteobacteria bacterium]
MKKNLNLNVEEIAWDDIKDDIKAANPALGAILEQFSPKLGFIRARYRYGDKILNQGVMHLPTLSGNTIPLSSLQVPERIRNKLSYSYVPLTFILNRSVEIFFESEQRVMPSKLLSSGVNFGLWEAFDPTPDDFVRKVWNISAGARTIFMLPKIADAIAHGRLKRHYGINTFAPKKLLDQHYVFYDLAHRISNEDAWYCDVLFFEGGWLEANENNLSSLKLHRYWLQEAWKQSYNCRTQMSYDVAWEIFSKEVSRRNWKPKPYIINTIKHLMAIGQGIFPGLAPVGDSNSSAPTNLIQHAYVNNYQIRHAPTIMCPHHLKTKEKPVYYSLALPTLLEFAPQSGNPRSYMADIRELKMMMDLLLSATKSDKVNYEFFHSEKDQYSEIELAKDIPKGDKNLLDYPKEFGKLGFADNSLFFHGCIRISLK